MSYTDHLALIFVISYLNWFINLRFLFHWLLCDGLDRWYWLHSFDNRGLLLGIHLRVRWLSLHRFWLLFWHLGVNDYLLSWLLLIAVELAGLYSHFWVFCLVIYFCLGRLHWLLLGLICLSLLGISCDCFTYCSSCGLLILTVLLDEGENFFRLGLVSLHLFSLLAAALTAEIASGGCPVKVHADAAWH